MLKDYQKPALTFEQQLALLAARGISVSDNPDPIQTLSSISYYRLSAYWYPFRLRDQQGNLGDKVQPNTSLRTILELYEFDRRLRSLILDAIERIEVAVRTQLTYHLAHTYGAFAHTNAAHFHPKFDHTQWIRKLEDETCRSSDEFIRHYKATYVGFPQVPIWMVTEVMSFGALSLLYSGLRNDQKLGVEDKKAVSAHFGLHHKRLGDWLHTLTYIRNVCAHHSRLWNRELAIRPDQSKDKQWLAPITPRNDRIFYVLLMLRHLLRATSNGAQWAQEMTTLLEPIANEPRWGAAMGIPKNWKEHPLWK